MSGHFFLTPMFRRSSASAARWIFAAQCPRVRPPEARSLLHPGVRRGDFWLSEASFISSPSPYDGRESGTNHSLLIFNVYLTKDKTGDEGKLSLGFSSTSTFEEVVAHMESQFLRSRNGKELIQNQRETLRLLELNGIDGKILSASVVSSHL